MNAADYEQITYLVTDPVALITLNRPERLNAWTMRMEAEFRDAVARAAADPRVVGIVLTGAGRGFCAGADLGSLDNASSGGDFEVAVPLPGEESWGSDLRGRYNFLYSVPKPVLAAINGPVAGVAVALALACDLRFMARGAVLVTSFAERGLVAEYGTSFTLPRLIGSAAALDLLLSSRKVGADEAFDLGLVNRVLEPDELLDAAREYVAAIARRCSPGSLAAMKRQVYQQLHPGLAAAEADAEQLMRRSLAGPDVVEGVAAFRERRAPRFARIGAAVPSPPSDQEREHAASTG